MRFLKSKRKKEKRWKKIIIASSLFGILTIGTGAAYASSPTIKDAIRDFAGVILNPMIPEIHRELTEKSNQYAIEISICNISICLISY